MNFLYADDGALGASSLQSHQSMARLFADTAPLRNPDFRRLWASGIVTVIGANLTIFAVPVQLYALTQNSAYVGLSGLFTLSAGSRTRFQ